MNKQLPLEYRKVDIFNIVKDVVYEENLFLTKFQFSAIGDCMTINVASEICERIFAFIKIGKLSDDELKSLIQGTLHKYFERDFILETNISNAPKEKEDIWDKYDYR